MREDRIPKQEDLLILLLGLIIEFGFVIICKFYKNQDIFTIPVKDPNKLYVNPEFGFQ